MFGERESVKRSSSQREVGKYEMDRGCRTRKQEGLSVQDDVRRRPSEPVQCWAL